MSNRVRRTVFIRERIHKNVFGAVNLYRPNQNVFTSSYEEYSFHSAEVKQLWLIPRNLTQECEFTLGLAGFQGVQYPLLPPFTISPDTPLIHITPLFPFSAERRNLELGVDHLLRAEVTPRLTGTQEIILNGFAEETGLAYDLTTT